MRSIVLAHEVDFAGWRAAARELAVEGVPPEAVLWSVGMPDDLFAGIDQEDAAAAPAPATAFTVPRPLVELAQTVIQARDPERFALLYGLIWRTSRGEKRVVEDLADPQVQRTLRLAQAVRRDTHKMRAFVRFRAVEPDAGAGHDAATRYVAWFEPDHYIVEANADFFVRRFATMVFSILTPYRCLHWTGTQLDFGPGADPSQVPDDDALERYWRAYFSSIFNPARLKVSAMTSEMPRKYWRNLPEAAVIPELVRAAHERTRTMLETAPMPRIGPRPKAAEASLVEPGDPPIGDLLAATAPATIAALARDAADCRRCPLWQPATQTVFGEGPQDAAMMMVGEQPGDQEDLAGRPFVGPAGQVLDRAMREAGIDRQAVYVTNAVKHFKFEPRGKRRIHQKPDQGEITACGTWLAEERRLVRPGLLLMLGATAARAVLGRAVTIARERGRLIPLQGNTQGLITVHPSYLLRLPDEEAKQREYAAFVADLRAASRHLESLAAQAG
ncbi:UdgX family uracil-DNA binding protein [Lichenicoccus sp.]|uniref:UdgX family uracil-DNA binding protein n=1 Tax=Lichenicoccus sp. TaxID=2781899 RepID=UPI003D0A56BF